MVEIVESALRELGVPEEVTAAGQFMPRGHTGSMFAGGLVGDSLTGSLGWPTRSAPSAVRSPEPTCTTRRPGCPARCWSG